MLEAFAKNIWVAKQKQKFFGLEIGTRMTVIDLNGQGDLLIHSPIGLTKELKAEIDKIGTVQFIVAPNKLHHLYIQDFRDAYRKARVYLAPGLSSKRPDLKDCNAIDADQEYNWATTVAYLPIQGIPLFNEVVFFHRESSTLIISDLGLHICDESPFLTRFFFKLAGTFGHFGLSKLERKIFIKDEKKFSHSLALILEWDFDKIILAHGRLITSDAKKIFEKAFFND